MSPGHAAKRENAFAFNLGSRVHDDAHLNYDLPDEKDLIYTVSDTLHYLHRVRDRDETLIDH
jgi:hypothetical protein